MSMTEILMILVIVLVVVGPEKIPEVAKFAGKAIREVRKASNLLRDAVMIDDLGPATAARPTPVNATPNFDQIDGTFDYEEEDPFFQDPTPKRNIKLVKMTPRQQPLDLIELPIATRGEEIVHREVYLHVPYEETI